MAGGHFDAGLAEATPRYDMSGPRLGIVAWVEPGAATDLGAVARTLAARVGGVHALVVPVGDHVV